MYVNGYVINKHRTVWEIKTAAELKLVAVETSYRAALAYVRANAIAY
jgi:hypothetical protein